MDGKIKLRVQGVTSSQIQSGAYALILAEEGGGRRIPVIVGASEAQSIAIALEHIAPLRPLTHDLFVAFMQAFHVRLLEVFIYKFEDGVFYAELLLDNGSTKTRLDSRTSDAIAIALRMQCPIYTTGEVLLAGGVVLEEDPLPDDTMKEAYDLMDKEPEEIEDEDELKKWLSFLGEDELNERLEEAITGENYEYAKMYKDEIRRRGEEEGKV